jgi:phage tail protein X
MLAYKNERAMSFEEFCKKFQKALQHFERANRAKHNGDVIDWIWNHVQNSELGQIVAALKASQGINARTPNQILQEIAKEIPNLSKGTSFQQRVSEVHARSDYTFEGDAPSSAMETILRFLLASALVQRRALGTLYSNFGTPRTSSRT